MEGMRLQKFLALSGVASRRKAEELISAGRVTVNGIKVLKMGTTVADGERVEVDGKAVRPEPQKVYIMLNKPVGYITTVKDQFSRPSVTDLVKNVKERIYPVGRLDYDTSGLLLMTNDGDFAFRLTHPRYETEKVYVAKVKGVPGRDAVEKFRKGIMLEGSLTAPAELVVLESGNGTSTVRITIHEGRNRQVRKMSEAVGHPVVKLKRIGIGGICLGDLPEGKWRELDDFEIETLKNSATAMPKDR